MLSLVPSPPTTIILPLPPSPSCHLFSPPSGQTLVWLSHLLLFLSVICCHATPPLFFSSSLSLPFIGHHRPQLLLLLFMMCCHPPPPPPSCLSHFLLFLFVLSLSVITSQTRAFGRYLPWPALVPFADCFNHDSIKTISYHYDPTTTHNDDGGDGTFRLFPTRGHR